MSVGIKLDYGFIGSVFSVFTPVGQLLMLSAKVVFFRHVYVAFYRQRIGLCRHLTDGADVRQSGWYEMSVSNR